MSAPKRGLYPRWVTPNFQPFDPLELIQRTEAIVTEGFSRKYTAFYCVGVYGGISTAYTVGCCLRCIFCWVDWSRDFPERLGQFYSPQEVCQMLLTNARRKGVQKLRISGGEPTLGWSHLLEVLHQLNRWPYLFILETNGILLGSDRVYARDLKTFNNIHVRVSIKAGTPEGFQARTGAQGSYYELPFRAVHHLQEEGVPFHVAAMTDYRLMSPSERRSLLQKLQEVGYQRYLEEEFCDPYEASIQRLEKAGLRL